VAWLIVQFKKPQGLALLRSLTAFEASIEELYVRRVGYRSNIYAIKVNTGFTTPEKLYRELSWHYKVELIAQADSLKLGEGWERVEFIAREARHREIPVLRAKLQYIRIGGREIPLANPKSWEPIEEPVGGAERK